MSIPTFDEFRTFGSAFYSNEGSSASEIQFCGGTNDMVSNKITLSMLFGNKEY
jgi:hypothetical protein